MIYYSSRVLCLYSLPAVSSHTGSHTAVGPQGDHTVTSMFTNLLQYKKMGRNVHKLEMKIIFRTSCLTKFKNSS